MAQLAQNTILPKRKPSQYYFSKIEVLEKALWIPTSRGWEMRSYISTLCGTKALQEKPTLTLTLDPSPNHQEPFIRPPFPKLSRTPPPKNTKPSPRNSKRPKSRRNPTHNPRPPAPNGRSNPFQTSSPDGQNPPPSPPPGRPRRRRKPSWLHCKYKKRVWPLAESFSQGMRVTTTTMMLMMMIWRKMGVRNLNSLWGCFRRMLNWGVTMRRTMRVEFSAVWCVVGWGRRLGRGIRTVWGLFSIQVRFLRRTKSGRIDLMDMLFVGFLVGMLIGFLQ